MSKVAVVETKELAVAAPAVSTPMALVPTSSAAMDAGFKAPEANQYLPNLIFIYPIMITPETPQFKGKEWQLVFKNGNTVETLPKGTVLTLIDKRNSARVKTLDENKNTKNNYYYDEVERGDELNLQKFSASTAGYNEAVKREASDPMVDTGYSMVLVAMFPDGRTVTLEFGCYKILPGYFYPSLGNAFLINGMGVRIDIDTHDVNLKKSQAGKFYPDVKKFKQYEQLQLTQEQVLRAAQAANASGEQYLKWLSR